MTDILLLAAVQKELSKCPYIGGCNLSCSVSSLVIKITGLTRSYYQKQMAGEAGMGLMRRLNCGATLLNQITVKSEPTSET